MDIFESLENLNVSEECFEDIIGLVEEYIHELNKYEQHVVDKNPELKEKIESNQAASKEIGKIRKDTENPYKGHRAMKILANLNRDLLGRDNNIDGTRVSKVSYSSPDREAKVDPTNSKYKAIRTEQSQRGSSKDVWNSMDPLMDKVRRAKGL